MSWNTGSAIYIETGKILDTLETVEELDALYKVVTNKVYAELFKGYEAETLRNLIINKRMRLEPPEKTLEETEPGIYAYWPEMGQKEPVGTQIRAERAYDGKHWFLDSQVELKRGQSITYEYQYTGKTITDDGRDVTGWYRYLVTNRAMEELKKKYIISHEMYLD